MVSWRIFEEGYQFVEGANGWGSDVALVVVSCHMRLGGGLLGMHYICGLQWQAVPKSIIAPPALDVLPNLFHG